MHLSHPDTEFKNSIEGEIGICRSQPLASRHICSLLLIRAEVTREGGIDLEVKAILNGYK